MPIPQSNPLMFDREPKQEAPINIDHRRPQLNEAIGRCHCGCACSQSRNNSTSRNDRSASASPLRGRSPTVREILSNTSQYPIDSRPGPRATEAHINADDGASIQGQEGVASYQLEEIGDLGTHTRRSIDQNLARYNQCSYPAPFNSPAESMAAEPSSGEHSMASSGYLMPLTRSPSAILGHTGGPFDIGDNGVASPQPISITPLWLNYERQFCRNLELGAGQGGLQMHYPITLDLDGDEFKGYHIW